MNDISVKQPLSNVQLELLKSFTHQLTDDELIELKRVLAHFFANRLMNEADKAWDENNWTEDDMIKMLNQKMRKRG